MAAIHAKVKDFLLCWADERPLPTSKNQRNEETNERTNERERGILFGMNWIRNEQIYTPLLDSVNMPARRRRRLTGLLAVSVSVRVARSGWRCNGRMAMAP